jgi:hypothetical protein
VESQKEDADPVVQGQVPEAAESSWCLAVAGKSMRQRRL